MKKSEFLKDLQKLLYKMYPNDYYVIQTGLTKDSEEILEFFEAKLFLPPMYMKQYDSVNQRLCNMPPEIKFFRDWETE